MAGAWGPMRIWLAAMTLPKRIGAVLGLLGGIAAIVLLLVSPDRSEQRELRDEYNSAVVDGDLDDAYRLLCADDRATITEVEFQRRYDDAVGSIGGFESWNQLRGGIEWIGRTGDRLRATPLVRDASPPCVEMNDSPLGVPWG